VKQHTGGVRCDAQLVRDFSIAHIVQISQTEDLRLLGGQLTDQLPYPAGQFSVLCLLYRARTFIRHNSPRIRTCVAVRPSESLPELVYRPGGSQPSQQGGKIPHALPPANLNRRNESLLKAVSRIRMIAQQSVRGLPYRRTVFFDNCLPVNHLQVPSEPLFLLRLLPGSPTKQVNFISDRHRTDRRYLSRRIAKFYYRKSQL
jgi:hypothetical protein